jgi:hypothetical protein
MITKEEIFKRLEKKTKNRDEHRIFIGGDVGGYGRLEFGGRKYLVHRLSAYIYYDLDLLDTTTLVCHNDVVCRIRSCWAPEHIYIGSHATNMRDSYQWNRIPYNSRKTHCPQGHEYTRYNTIINNRNQRYCKVCDNLRHNIRNNNGPHG